MAKTYDLKNVVCTVSGAPINGYGENDAIAVEWDSDLSETTRTADGKHVYNRLNDRGMTLTLTLMGTSYAHTLMAGFLEAQHGDSIGIAPPVIVGLPFFLYDPGTGTTYTGSVVFMNRPALDMGPRIGEVTYRLHMSNPKVIHGANNLVP